MKATLITAVTPNFPVVKICIAGQLIESYKGLPQHVGIHEAINYRASCGGALLPFSRQYATYGTPERLRCHLPYFQNCTRLY